MPSLSVYRQELDYGYAPGLYPSMECLLNRPDAARRVLLHSKSTGTPGADKLRRMAEDLGIRVEEADRALARISGKENCFAAVVFSKWNDDLNPNRPHVVLHNPSDSGNVGTILRTCLGFGVEDVALIRPCVDVFDPHTVRASMGSLFSLNVHVYNTFDEYRADFPAHALYPFMLTGSTSLPLALPEESLTRWTLIFGNEGSGLPESFAEVGHPIRIPSNDRIDSLNLSIAAAIGIYTFTQKTGLSSAT